MFTLLKQKVVKFAEKIVTEDSKPEDSRRMVLLLGLSIVGIIFLFIFSLLAFRQNNNQLGIFNIVTSLILVINLLDAAVRKKINTNIKVGITFVSLLYIYLYATGGVNNTAFVWYFTYPLIACYLLGSKLGGISSVLMIFPVFMMILINPTSSFFAKYEWLFLIRFIAAYLVIGVFSYFFERTREINQKNLDTINKTLETTVEQRTNELTKVNKKLILDINQRKAIEKKLENSEKRYRSLFENAEDAIFILDASPEKMGRIVDANQSAATMHGYTIEELKGLNIKDLDTKNDADKVEERVRPIFEGEWIKHEINHVRKDGSIFPVEISAGLIEIENNKFIIAIDRDIEERKKIETRLRKSEKMEAIGTLAGGIAHDFNNILSAILGYTELAKMKIPKESPVTQNLDQVYTAGNRAKDLVRQILTLARQSDNVMTKLSVASITKEALKLLRATLPSTIEIEQKIESKSLIIGDSTQIHQIIMNLCTNAAHAMEEKGGVLEVSLSDTDVSSNSKNKTFNLKPGNYMKLVISDDGAGIPDDVIKSIFEPYFTTKKTGEGTGLGLAIVHGIVESHGGEITVDTVLGDGTKFTVYLPISQKTKRDLSKNEDALVTGNGHILLVDDEAAIVEIHKQFLEEIGYSVSTRMNGIEALELFQAKSNKFDLVITDMTMPKMTGDALATKLRAIKPDIPIIICTGYNKKISNELVAEIGINAICYKPLSMSDLAKTIGNVLIQ